MLQTFLTVFGQMIIVLAFLAIGYLFNLKKWIPKEAEMVLSKLVTMLFLPCLTFNTFLSRCNLQSLIENSSLVLYGAISVAVFIAISYPISKLLSGGDSYLAGVLRYCIAIPNTGGVAIPLTLSMYGSMGLFRLSLFTLPFNIATYSWGLTQLLPSEGKKTFWQSFRSILNPNFLAMLAGAVLGLTGVAAHLPQPVFDGLERLGGCYTVISLILAGYVIADYQPKDIFGDRRVYWMTALRLVILPLLTLGVLKLLHVNESVMLFACLVVTCPCGMNTVVFPAAYRKDSRFGASLVLISSALAVVTVPLIFALMRL